MQIQISTTNSVAVFRHIQRVRAHGTSTNSTPPPATVTLTAAEPFNWFMTSSGETVYHSGPARIVNDWGEHEGTI